MRASKEQVFLVVCKSCGKEQQTFTTKKPFPKRKICCYCGKKFSIDKLNLIKQIR